MLKARLLIATKNDVRKIKIVAQGYDGVAKLLKYMLHVLERGSPLSICPLIYKFIPYAMFTSYLTFSELRVLLRQKRRK